MIANESPLFQYLIQLGDDALILSHRLSEWCGHGPVLEQDIALTNIALDILGQSRLWYQYAAEQTTAELDEDKLAYFRSDTEYRNVILVEQPNGDWGQTVARQFLHDNFKLLLFKELAKSSQPVVAEIAHKCQIETTYHVKWANEWLVRLGDGTVESNKRVQEGLNKMWRFHLELIQPSGVDLEMHGLGIAPDLNELKDQYAFNLEQIIKRANLQIPKSQNIITGGKKGIHSEHLGFILAEMQHLQRSYPGQNW